MNHAMLDLETLDTVETGVILSVGACAFNMDGEIGDDKFKMNVDLLSQPNRSISQGTRDFWGQRDTKIRRRLYDPEPRSLRHVLNCLRGWFLSAKCTYIWGNGSTFDVSMIEHAFRTEGGGAPLAFPISARCANASPSRTRVGAGH